MAFNIALPNLSLVGQRQQGGSAYLPTITIGTGSTVRMGWTGQPTSGDISTLVAAGLISYTGTMTAAYNAPGQYWGFTVTTGTITAKSTGMTYLLLSGNSITWVYDGTPLPSLVNLYLLSSGITYVSSAALPVGLTYLYLSANGINWTGFDAGGTGVYHPTTGLFTLSNFLTTAMTGAQLIALLTSMANRAPAATLPNLCTIGEYANSGDNETDESPKLTVIGSAAAYVDGTVAQQIKYWIEQVLAHDNVTNLTITQVPFFDALAATNVTSAGFTANWGAFTGADHYRLDVTQDFYFEPGFGEIENQSVAFGTNLYAVSTASNGDYYYRLRAEDAANTVLAYTNIIHVVVPT